MKISFCVFFILSAYTENTRKVFKYLWRMRGKYLSVFRDYAESIYAYMEKMANWGYLRYTKSSPNTRKVFKHIRRMRGKNLCVHGEYAKRLLTYSLYTPKDIKVYLSGLVIIRILILLYSFYLHYMAKKPYHATVLLTPSQCARKKIKKLNSIFAIVNTSCNFKKNLSKGEACRDTED